MENMNITRRRMLTTTGALLASGVAVRAQEAFPTKQVHLFVPFPPGGAVDIVGRTIGDELTRRWGGVSVIIENRPGAGVRSRRRRWRNRRPMATRWPWSR